LEDQHLTAEKQPVSTHTTINTTEVRRGGATVFILGGLVVAVLGIGYFLFSGGSFEGIGTPAGGGDVSISIETSADSGGESAVPDDAPENASDPAPADPSSTAPAPAD